MFSGYPLDFQNWVGGGFKYFLFSSLFGEDSHFDYCNIFQLGWNHKLEKIDYQSILPTKIFSFATFSLTSFLPISPQMGDRLEPLATTAAVPGGGVSRPLQGEPFFLFLDSTGWISRQDSVKCGPHFFVQVLWFIFGIAAIGDKKDIIQGHSWFLFGLVWKSLEFLPWFFFRLRVSARKRTLSIHLAGR